MKSNFFQQLFAFAVISLLSSCGGGGSGGAVDPGNADKATAAPYIYAQVNSYAGISQSSASVDVLEEATDSVIANASVILNGVPLSYDTVHQSYQGTLKINPGDVVSLIVTIGSTTAYTATGSQFTTYPTISTPHAGAFTPTGITNYISWSSGSPTYRANVYGLGILDADNPAGVLIWPPGDYLLSIPLGTSSYLVPANTLTPGNRVVVVGIAQFNYISGAASGSALIISGYGSVPVTVKESTLESILVTPDNPHIAKGTTQQFAATGFFSSNDTLDLTTRVTWETSAVSKATIDNLGTAQGVGIGTSTITARLGPTSGSTELTVTPAILESIVVSLTNVVIDPGTSYQLTAIGTFSDGSRQDITALVTWSSSDHDVATISNQTGSNGTVAAVASGSTMITAQSGIVSGTGKLDVASLISIKVTPASRTIPKGTSLQFIATGTYSDWNQQDLSASVLWDSSDPTKVSISNQTGSKGKATSLASGTSTISASLGTISGATDLTVSLWTAQTTSTQQPLRGGMWDGTQFIIVGGPSYINTILTSFDGITWEQHSPGTLNYLVDIAWSGTTYVSVGTWGTLITSLDGKTWTLGTSGTIWNLYGVVWSGTQFVAVGEYGTILTSPDGGTWTVRASGTTNDLWDIVWTGSQYFVVGYDGIVLRSANGLIWTKDATGAGGGLTSLTWSGTQFVAVGWNGTGAILTSPDGVSWTSRASGTDFRLYGVAWCGAQYIAVGMTGTILVSPDGVTWSASPSGTWNDLSGVVCKNGTDSVVVGNESTILTYP